MPLTLAQIDALLADNTAGDISAADMRDVAEALYQWVPVQERYKVGRLVGETVHASDVFPLGTSPGGTAYAISGTGVWTQEDGALSVVFNNQSAGDAAGRGYAISLSAPVTVETCVDIQIPATGVPHVGVCFTDGTAAGSNVAAAFMTHLSSPAFYYYSGTLTDINAAFASAAGVMQSTYARFYVRMVWKAANTFNAQWSPSGAAGSWTGFGLADQSKTMTPTHFGPIVTTWGGAEECVATFRYFRVADADLSA